MITIDTLLAAAPSHVRETFDDDPDTLTFITSAIDGKDDASDVRRAVTPFLGMSTKELDAMFAKLDVSPKKPEPLAEAAPAPPSPEPAGRKGRLAKKKAAQATPSVSGAQTPTAPVINAYSQQSRFHAETLTTLSKDVDLRDVNVTIGDAPLLTDARLWLKAGQHYGLVGRNGAGKSTLLSVIGDKSLVGFPPNVRTLYVAQLDVVDAEGSVLEAVLAADAEREVRVRDVRAIEGALQDPEGLKAALEGYIRRIAAERTLASQKLATLRSGKRGKIARGKALEAEHTMVADVRAEVYAGREADAEAAAHVLAELYDQLDKMDAHSAEARARAILASLGVSDAQADGPVARLSGGWRMRVALAKALFIAPDILLLDEATNHLDLAAIAWLQDYLVSLRDEGMTVVCVSHDRDFLNAVSQEIIRLKEGKLTYHPGNYDEYEQTEDELRKKKERQLESLQRRREHVQKSIESFMKHARGTGDDKVLSQAASRKKKLERLAGSDKTEDGKRFKVSYWAGFHDTMRPEIELAAAEKSVDLKLPAPPQDIRTAGPLITLNRVSFAYPKPDGRPGTHRVLKSIDLSIMPGDHIAILGLNGCGKSTLVSLLNGSLAPTSGRVDSPARLKIAHYTQHFVDELSSEPRSGLALLASLHPGVKEGELRRQLGAFELSGGLATRPASVLSGGQRARLAMAVMLFDAPHVLLLDEITNHLDMYAVQGLISALNEYEGTVVLVTHDRHFVRECADAVYVLEAGRLTWCEEGVDGYLDKFAE